MTGRSFRDATTGCISLKNSVSGMTSRRDCDSAIYSLSVVDSAISVWSLEDQMIGQFAYRMRYPVRDMTDVESSLQPAFQPPAKKASTKASMLLFLSGL